MAHRPSKKRVEQPGASVEFFKILSKRIGRADALFFFWCDANGQPYKKCYKQITMSWIILIIAGLFEAAFATCLGMAHHTRGKISTYWFIAFVLTLSISMVLLYIATQKLPIGTAYAVWTGIGAVTTVIIGILLFKEPATFWRLFFIFTLIASIMGLKAVSVP